MNERPSGDFFLGCMDDIFKVIMTIVIIVICIFVFGRTYVFQATLIVLGGVALLFGGAFLLIELIKKIKRNKEEKEKKE